MASDKPIDYDLFILPHPDRKIRKDPQSDLFLYNIDREGMRL
jgi:hypothetical protein